LIESSKLQMNLIRKNDKEDDVGERNDVNGDDNDKDNDKDNDVIEEDIDEDSHISSDEFVLACRLNRIDAIAALSPSSAVPSSLVKKLIANINSIVTADRGSYHPLAVDVAVASLEVLILIAKHSTVNALIHNIRERLLHPEAVLYFEMILLDVKEDVEMSMFNRMWLRLIVTFIQRSLMPTDRHCI
jgi:hypothetical protein